MQTVLITGAGREKGIGAATARAFSKAGYAVVIHYNKSGEQAEAIASSLPNAVAIAADLRASDEVFALRQKIEKVFPPVSVLINNAGVAYQGLFTDMTNEEIDEQYQVNLRSMLYTSREFAPDMIRNKAGSIINISSIWGITGASCEVAYSAMKAGVIGFTKALAKELAPCCIRVNCIAPGVIATDMLRGLSDETMTALEAETPLGRLGSPLDIAHTALFLADTAASGFITGQVISPNGGILI